MTFSCDWTRTSPSPRSSCLVLQLLHVTERGTLHRCEVRLNHEPFFLECEHNNACFPPQARRHHNFCQASREEPAVKAAPTLVVGLLLFLVVFGCGWGLLVLVLGFLLCVLFYCLVGWCVVGTDVVTVRVNVYNTQCPCNDDQD